MYFLHGSKPRFSTLVAMREFPLDYHARRGVQMYPEERELFAGDFLEIGPGRGDLLLDLAERYPDKQLVAIELAGKRYFKLVRRIKRRELTNVHLIWAPAQLALPRYCGEQSFERAYVLFPDPWPKKRHAPHRLLQVAFLKLLATRIAPGGSFFFATDVSEYAHWVVENLTEVDTLTIQGTPFSTQEEMADYFPTFFEQKWREEGRVIHYLHCTKG